MRKKLLALIMAGAMALTVLAVGPGALAADVDYVQDDVEHGDGVDEPLSKLLTMSDYQRWYPNGQYNKDDWDALQPQLQEIVDGASGADVNPDYFLFGGDFSCLGSLKESSDEGESQVLRILRDTWPNLTDEKCVLIQGNHDPDTMNNIAPMGPTYYKDFIIYVLNEDFFPTKQDNASVKTLVESTAEDLDKFLDECCEKEEKRPIIIASHTGLHYDIDRKDGNNQYAYIMFDTIDAYADDLDVIFMFGHNHTNGDEQVGGSITFYPVGSELAVCHEDSISKKAGTKTELKFTYMNYGYIGYIGDINNNSSEFKPTNILTIGMTEIYNDRIEIRKYSKNGIEEAYSNTIERKNKIIPEPVATEAPAATEAPKATDAPVVQQTAPAVQQTAPAVTDTNTTPAAKAKIAITGKKTVKVGKSAKYKAKLTNLKGKVKWSVNKKKLATISKAGKLVAKKKGTVKVTAKCGKVKASISVKIK